MPEAYNNNNYNLNYENLTTFCNSMLTCINWFLLSLKMMNQIKAITKHATFCNSMSTCIKLVEGDSKDKSHTVGKVFIAQIILLLASVHVIIVVDVQIILGNQIQQVDAS